MRLAASSGQHLNPFDLAPAHDGDEEGDPLAEQVAALQSLLELMLAEPGEALGTHERALLDRALYRTYAEAGITEDPATHGRAAPLLGDLHRVLTSSPGDVAAARRPPQGAHLEPG